jgi:hypothetical protein
MSVNTLANISERILRYLAVGVVAIFALPYIVLYFLAERVEFTEINYTPILARLAGLVVGIPALVIPLLFSSRITYWMFCSLIVLIALVSLVWGRRKWPNLLLSLTAITLICIFMTMPYKFAVQSADGYHMVSPTVPVLFERGLKNAQVLGEFTPCKYSLVGWQQSVLVYQALCNNQSTFFVFDPYSNSVSVSNAPTVDKLQTNAVAHTEVLDWFRDPSVFPSEVELASRELSLRGLAMIRQMENGWQL